MTATPALRAWDIARWVIGLLVGDLLRWAWRADQPAAREFTTWCAWCARAYTTTTQPATATTPPPRWYRCDPDRGLGDHVWWCSLRCMVEHGRADVRAVAIDAEQEAPDLGD